MKQTYEDQVLSVIDVSFDTHMKYIIFHSCFVLDKGIRLLFQLMEKAESESPKENKSPPKQEKTNGKINY